MERLLDWRDKGAYSCTDACVGMDNSTADALRVYELDRNAVTGGTASPTVASCGSRLLQSVTGSGGTSAGRSPSGKASSLTLSLAVSWLLRVLQTFSPTQLPIGRRAKCLRDELSTINPRIVLSSSAVGSGSVPRTSAAVTMPCLRSMPRCGASAPPTTSGTRCWRPPISEEMPGAPRLSPGNLLVPSTGPAQFRGTGSRGSPGKTGSWR